MRFREAKRGENEMLNHEDKSQLLQDLTQVGSYGRAEEESKEKFLRTFHPVAEHMRAFDPSVVLVTGPRGSGKSELFKAVTEFALLPAIHRCLPKTTLPSAALNQMKWIAGYPIGKGFPAAPVLTGFLQSAQYDSHVSRDIWSAYLVRVLWNELDEPDRVKLSSLIEPIGGDIVSVHAAFKSAGDDTYLALDRLDSRLEEKDLYIFIGYDELDLLGAESWDAMRASIRGLVAFWAANTRRWSRIRAKIFLRTDLFQRYATEGGPDLAKLAANRVDLYWSDKNLYAMLLKRVANTSDDLWQYVTNVKSKVQFIEDEDLGHIPKLADGKEIQPFIDRMIGKYMGSSHKKGLTYTWLINHIRDGNDLALPRPLVRLIEVAAELQLDSSRSVQGPKLIDPIALRRALEKVSEDHFNHSRDEWPWLIGMKNRLKGQLVLWQRRELEELLKASWEAPWDGSNDIRPPEDSPHDLIDYTVEVGIFRARSDGRIDVPDLYLYGLGLKRKGGVRKK